jgi:hypothetical protein
LPLETALWYFHRPFDASAAVSPFGDAQRFAMR